MCRWRMYFGRNALAEAYARPRPFVKRPSEFHVARGGPGEPCSLGGLEPLGGRVAQLPAAPRRGRPAEVLKAALPALRFHFTEPPADEAIRPRRCLPHREDHGSVEPVTLHSQAAASLPSCLPLRSFLRPRQRCECWPRHLGRRTNAVAFLSTSRPSQVTVRAIATWHSSSFSATLPLVTTGVVRSTGTGTTAENRTE